MRGGGVYRQKRWASGAVTVFIGCPLRGSFRFKEDNMKVEIFRLTNEPVVVEVRQNGTVKDVFSHPDSGKVLRYEGTLLEAANEMYGGIERLGTLRVNGVPATLETAVTEGATILIIPKVEGGRQ